MKKKQQIKGLIAKELSQFFYGPSAWIIISVFLVLTGWFFFSTYFIKGQVELKTFFTSLPYIFSILIPALTMGQYAQEYNLGSYESLKTLPISQETILIAKFMATGLKIIALLIPTFLYIALVKLTGTLATGPVVSSYLGTLLLGILFSSIGLLFSSLTNNQIIAFILSSIFCFFLLMIHYFAPLIPSNFRSLIEKIGVIPHFTPFTMGIIDSKDILYFLSFALFNLVLCLGVHHDK